jgi:hypothetical protein
MARTFIRQETQIRRSDLYDDTIPPTLAAYETNPTQIEEDLNNIRSQLQNFLNRNGAGFPGGNWYADLSAPVTFENGTQRGINETNQQLHDLERKRVLVEVFNPNDVPIGTQATGTLTATANFGNTETVTTGTKTYTFQTVLTNVDGNVLIGASLADSLNNLAAAIALGAGSGTVYAAATTANTFVYAASTTATTLVLLAKQGGTAGNSIATTETAANASFGGATLSGGVATNVSILTMAAMLPGNTTLAIGIVSTRGTVAAAQGGTFGAHSLTQVSGATITSPKNLVPVVNSVTHDPVLSSGRRVYALFQSESVTDGSTATVLTPNRVQLSYVRLDVTGSVLEAVPSGDISGQLIHYSATERKALEDFNEQDFLRGTSLDVPSSSTVTRQVAYDNQGTTPVELLTDATLDLNSAGITWAIRDLLNANLFRIVEGSGGGTSMVAIDADVDTFDVSALVNDFDQGVRVDTGGQRINIGETGGLIESTSTNDLRILGAGELYLDDGNQTGSTWTQTAGIKLSDTTAEWDLFETNFGEVSLLNAINQAYQNVARGSKVYANVTSPENADVDIGGLAGGANLDVQLPDLSGGSFLLDYDVFLNGELLRPGANAAANNDYYPGTSLVNGQLKMEFKVKVADVICVIPYI